MIETLRQVVALADGLLEGSWERLDEAAQLDPAMVDRFVEGRRIVARAADQVGRLEERAGEVRERALELIRWERLEQESKAERARAEGMADWRTPADPLTDDATRFAVLVEEVGEVAKELNERRVGKVDAGDQDLIGELVQVAAVAVAWLEALA